MLRKFIIYADTSEVLLSHTWLINSEKAECLIIIHHDLQQIAADSRGIGPVADPTGGALWYHADHVTPDWDMDIIRQAKIGRHVFYRRK